LKRAVLAVSLLLASCGGNVTAPSTPPGPNSPQTTVALANTVIANTTITAVQAIIAMRDAGKISQANTDSIENWLAIVAHADRSIGLILAKNVPWDQQKKEILTLLTTITAPMIAGTIEPGAQVIIAQIQTLLAQIKTQVAP